MEYTANLASRSDTLGRFGMFASNAASYLLLGCTWLCGAVMTVLYVVLQDEEGYTTEVKWRLVSGC